MKKLVKNSVLSLILLLVICAGVQNLYGQSAVPDTLKQLLARIALSTDESLKKAVRAVQADTSRAAGDSLSQKLLLVDSLLVNTQNRDPSLAVPYASLLIQLLSTLPPVQEHPDYVSSLYNLGLLYFKMGRYDDALPLFRKTLDIRKRVLDEQDPRYAVSVNTLAVVYTEMGRFDKALPLSLQSCMLTKKIWGEGHPRHASSVNNLAALYRKMGQYDQALLLYKQALAIKKKVLGEAHADYAGSVNNLAYLYNVMGQYEKALPLYEQALFIQKKALGEAHPAYASTLNNLAYLYNNIGQYEKALPLYEQALAIEQKTVGEAHPDYALTLNNLSNMYSNWGRYDKALPLQQQAILIQKKALGEAHPSYAAGLNNLANLFKSMAQYGKALPLYEEALAIKKKSLGEDHPDYALSLNNLALLYQQMGQHEKAIPPLQRAIAVYKKVAGEAHPDYAFSLNNLALCYATLGSPVQAAALFSEAADRTVKNLTQTYTTLSEGEKLTFLDNEAYAFNYLPSLLFAQGIKKSALVSQLYTTQLALKGMVLEDQQTVLKSIRKEGDSTAVKLYEQWRTGKTLTGRLLLLPVAGRLPHLDSLEKTVNQLEQQLSLRTAAFRNLQHRRTVTVHDVARKLQKGEAAIEFIQFKLYRGKWTDSILYAALLLLPGDSNARFIPLFEEGALQRLLAAPGDGYPNLYMKTAAGKTAPSSAISDSLYELIWRPLEQDLTGIHAIYFAPAGLLHRIAFQALQADRDHLLLDLFELNQVLSTRSIVLPEEPAPKPHTASLWGNISYDITGSVAGLQQTRGMDSGDTTAASFNFYTPDSRGERGPGWDSLPFSREEINSVQKVLAGAGIRVATSSGAFATEEAFKALDGTGVEVLHLATHGFFLPPAQSKRSEWEAGGSLFRAQQNPMFRSGLVLAGGNRAWAGERAVAGKEDGILTAYEIAQLNLSNTRLAILSACGTALGDIQKNEGVIGLQRALKMAGVQQMIISLWEVPDKATCELMALFYQHWLAGHSARAALRAAQRTMKEKYPPYYWAAFVLVE